MNEVPPTRYPLAWPPGWRRTLPATRRRARFGTARAVYGDTSGTGERVHMYDRRMSLTTVEACERIITVLEQMDVAREHIVISTNLTTRNDGLPRAIQRQPEDPGACAYWTRKGQACCMPIDHYDRVQDNLGAIAATLGAMRAIERHGGAAVLNRAFEAFMALPNLESWWQILGLKHADATIDEIKQAHRRLVSEHHPDIGGDSDRMARINRARDIGMQVMRG